MFRRLMSLDEVRRVLEENFRLKPTGTEQVSVSQTYNRVLAEDVVALRDVPPFDRSTVDGYAVRASDTFGADENKPVPLRLCGEIAIGELPRVVVEQGAAAGTVTGAPVPRGANAVVMMEYTSRDGDIILLHRPVFKRENVMRAGSDIKKGETVLHKGETLSFRKIGVLAAVGLKKVHIYKRPKVAVLSTGAEIVNPGEKLPPGKIYDINAYTLSAAVLDCGGEAANLGIVPDERDQLEAALEQALDSADVVVTSGGVSVGPKDLVPQVVDTLGKPGVIVCGVAIKPGKPTTIALVDGKPVFSLPGNPTSALLIFHLMVRPIISRMGGRPEEPPVTLEAQAATKMFPARGRRTFIMVKLASDELGELLASPVPLGLSGAITTLSNAEGFVEIQETQQFIDAGDQITVQLFESQRKE